ncbi:probable JmjC domain-containing histone demethylation protein 2C isoform X3 [Camponotus floridanus]|uniref:probable JmjC domain-containing histone demethylation protein 2C isoform X3 n=1 Tax=Camponotus floridanus TaxID=104421 RepID=UPI000DC6650C|nr:probable JmjC domain-containing histone demethylation protein 2C isoform X3 [Camponotus floridanus]
MAYKFREEIVGKRFLSVSDFTKLKVNKISEWGWRAGVIRAASHRDNGCHDLQILVEYDDVEWQRREWLSPHRDAVFSFFLIERGLYWAERPDPRHASLIPIDHHNHANNNHHQHRINGKPLRGATAVADTVAWPALTFYPLVARAELHEDAMPIEFMQDRKLDFVDYSKLKPFTQDWELTKGTMPWRNAVRRWAEMQDGQRILLTTPSILVGFRVEVYRAEGTTQWYTAVIVGYNESTKDLTVTDDTVLEDHNEDPTLVQMRLIGDGVVESIMRGEVVGMTPRRSRSSTALTHALVVPRPGRRPRRRPGNAAQLQATPRVQSPISQHLEKEKNNARNNRRRRVSEGASREKTEKESTEAALSTRQQEDRENKGPPSGKVSNRVARPVLEEANSASGSASKLRRRGAAVKSPTADHQGPAQHQRPVRRRPRPGSGQEVKPGVEEESVEHHHHHHRTGSGARADKDERLGSRSEEEEEEEEEERALERENEESPERCDPLTKRLRTSPVGRKLRSESSKGKNAEEAAADRAGEVVVEEDEEEDDKEEEEAGVEKHDRAEREVDKLEENEESQSRERDREPEPPPPDKVDPGGNPASEEQQPDNNPEPKKDGRAIDRGAAKIGERKEQQQQRQQQHQQQPPQFVVNGLHVDSPLVSDKTNVIREDSPSLLKSTTRSKAKGFAEEDGEDARARARATAAAAAAEDERDENASEEEAGSQRSRRTELTTTELGTEDSVGSVGGARAASVESVVELLESSSQDSGSVLERLSPLSSSGGGGPGRQNSLLLEQQREQERSRHNESPIILAERLNKPPPPIAGHHHHHHLQPYHQPPHQQQQQQQQQYHHHHQQHHQQRYSAGSPVIHHHHQQQQPPPPPQHHHHHHHHHQLTSSSHQHHHHHPTHLTPSGLLEVQQQSHTSRGGDEAGGGLMEVEPGAGIPGAGVLAGVSTAIGGIRASGGSNSGGIAGTYGDSGSDSGVSSLRSAGSGDERSGSRSSALSVEETTSSSTPSASITTSAAPARVWHVQSIQHTTLLMAHPQGAPNAPANAAATAPPVGYQSPAPPGHHAAVASDMLWRPIQSRTYPPLSHTLLGPQQPSPEELLERDRHERLLRERREAEVRELEKAKMERERLEKQRAEQAVHKHFEESFRLAQQKRNMQTASIASWNNFLPIVPPPTHPASRTHGAPSGLTAHAAASHRGHPGHLGGTPGGAPAAAVTTHSVSVAQQQQREREEYDKVRDIREIRERDAVLAVERQVRQIETRDHIAAQQRAAYYATSPAQQVSRPSSVPGKVEYPPPPAHSRTSKSSLPVGALHEKPSVVGPSHSSLPKAEPNVNLFNYSSTYQPSCSPYMHDLKIQNELRQPPPKSLPSKSGLAGDLERDHHGREVLQNPPSLLPDHKSSVIVKNEGRELAKAPAPQQHSSSSRSYLSLQPVAPQHKSSAYEAYRSPTQSPHHLHPAHLDGLQAAKSIASSASHHRSSSGAPTTTTTQQLPSPHSHPPPPPAPEPRLHPHNPRQSPHAPPPQHPHQPPPPPHPSPPEPRYLNRPEPAGLPYSAAKSTYSYPHPPTASPTPSSHYPTPPPAGSKPKVSSPAPPHIYGKPNSGIMTGTPVCRASEPPVAAPIPLTSKAGSSPYQQVPHHHGAPPPLPPPAHSRVYESRFVGSLAGAKLPPPPLHGSPPTAASAPLSRPIAHPAHPAHLSTSPHQQSGQTLQHAQSQITTAFQTQPLDLGVERSGSPKRKAPTPLLCDNASGQPVSLEVCKKRRTEEPQPLSLQCVGQPVLSRVSEPSPLIASAATSITTVVNTALLAQSNSQTTQEQRTVTAVSPAPGTASGDGSTRPASTGSVCSLNPTPLSAAPSPAPIPSPAPSTAPSPAPSAPGTPAKVNPSTGADSEKSNSPAPRPPSSTSYPGHKLKKAWLQRHSRCEDGTENTTNMVSTVSLPLISRETSSSNSKDRDTSNTSNVNANNSSAPITCLPSAVNSIHNIGSMAVNSINKSKVTGKSGRKPANKESLNGHATDTSKTPQEDSSSSDPERKSPPKRKPPKVKRKKGAARRQQTAAEDQRRRKEEKQGGGAGAGSESSNESEAGSASDTSEQLSTIQPASRVRHTTANSNNSSGNGNNKEPRKRGRRPKTTKGNEVGGEDQQPRQKKERRDDSTSGGNNGPGGSGGRGDPFRKPPISQLKKTGESWLQDGACFEVAPKLAKCRECRWTPHQRSKNLPQNIFCRFYAFRRLRYTKNGQLAIAGFSDPHKDASEEDLRLWLPGKDNQETTGKDDKSEKNEKDKGDREDLDLETAHRLLRQVGDQFCDLLHQEKDALQEHMAEASSGVVDGTVAWKRVIQGVREMCDVCETTLFNYHWACGKCGFVVCIDCYKGRKNGTIKIWGESGKDRDEFSWLLCTNRQAHEPERLMLTQIIAGDSLLRLGQRLHECRAEWGILQHCACSLVTSTQSNEVLRNLIKGDSVPVLNGNVKQEIKEEKKMNESNGASESKTNGEDKNSPLNWLADVALQNQDKNESGSSSDSDEDREGNYSTLRELLIRPSHKSNGSGGSRSNSPTTNSGGGVNATSATGNTATQNNVTKSGKKSKMDTLDEVISSVIEHSVKKDISLGDAKPRVLKYFVRRYKWTQRGREPLPIRIMTLTESKSLYPDVPHSWLCNGKLLRLNDPNNPNNYRIFQDQWKRGQPVIVSDVSKALDMNLWHPDSFARDFGDEKNDLINCMTGNLVPNQPMRKFWEGFENFSKRLKDERGNPMLLKLKDWPPGEDFAELLPSRFTDLMKVLPLSEYTHRNGRLNLASRLPNCFVRPDLGPKMYNAYGSALHPSKGTTNLHLDISDAVNVMVYVGIPKDADNDEHIKEALKAIDEAGCDVLTRRRARDPAEAPGALWHIYAARDADKIRDLLNAVSLERGARLEPHHDPIHDQSCYLDGPLRERLYREYGVEGYAIVQCLGDAVFVPAGAPHQVRNLHNCIKVAEDFVSPENVSHCFHLTQEFRALSDTHTNHEDKLQIKNIIYHAVKDSLTVLANVKEETIAKLAKANNETKIKEET